MVLQNLVQDKKNDLIVFFSTFIEHIGLKLVKIFPHESVLFPSKNNVDIKILSVSI